MYRYGISQNILKNLRFGLTPGDGGGHDIRLTFPEYFAADEFTSFLSGHYDVEKTLDANGYTLTLRHRPATSDANLVCAQGFIQLLSARYAHPAAELCTLCEDETLRDGLHAACHPARLNGHIRVIDEPDTEGLIVSVGACEHRDAFCNWLGKIYDVERIDADGTGENITLLLSREKFSHKTLNKAKDVVDLTLTLMNAWGLERHHAISAIEPQAAREYVDAFLAMRPDAHISHARPEDFYTQDTIYVGGGFTGVSAMIQDLKRLIADRKNAPVRMRLIEQKMSSLGGGLAYSAAGFEHDVNVQASYLSVDPENPDDFVEWLKAVVNYNRYNAEDIDLNVPGGLTVPDQDVEKAAVQRKLYQFYLMQRLYFYVNTARRLGLADVEFVIDKVTDADTDGAKTIVTLESGRVLKGTALVLATGHGPTMPPKFIADAAAAMPQTVFPDQWEQRYQVNSAFLSPDTKDVVVLGTGLSAMDIIKTALKTGFLDRADAQLTLVSRGGNLHPVDDPARPYIQRDTLLSELGDLPQTVEEVPGFVTRGFEYLTRIGESEIGRPYSAEEVTHALMPLIPEFLEKTNLDRVALFGLLRKYSSLVNTSAVSMTKVMGEILDEYTKLGRIRVLSAEPVAIEDAGGNRARIALKDGGSLNADAVISTLPPQSTPEKIDLYKKLMAKGLVQKELRTGFGLETDFATMRAVRADGTIVPNLFVIGPIVGGEAIQAQGRIGPAFQTISGLREQARTVAEFLAADRGQRNKPCVAILMNSHPDQRDGVICQRWKHSMEAFGMQVVLIPPQTEKQILDQLLERVNGVLLTGGDANVHPRFYDQTPIPGQSFDVARTQTAIYLARECANRGIPALGVCLGSQEMNVALGGKLQQSVDGHDHGYVNPHSRDDIAHDIRVMDGGMLSEIFGAQAAHGVTSVHRQGYYKDDLAPGLRVEALDDASPLVEAFSKSGHPFFMGVQFHVEFHPRDPKNFAIFSRFTQEAVAHFRKLADDKKGVCELPGLKPIINAC